MPVDQNVLKVVDLDDHEPNYSLSFSIKGANASWTAPQDSGLDGSDSTSTSTSTSGNTSPPSPGGLSNTAKLALGIAIPVVVLTIGVCIGLWLRNRRDEARRGKHPLRTMSTDNTPTRYKSEDQNYSTPIRSKKAVPELQSGSSTRFSPIKKLFFSEKEVSPTLDQVSSVSIQTERDSNKSISPPHGTSPSNSSNGKGTRTPTQRRTAWDDDFPTPRNHRTTASNGEDEIEPSVERRYMSDYSAPQNKPESPTPKRRSVSAPVLENGYSVARQLPPPNQHWELSAGTPHQSHANLVRPPYELPLNQRLSSSPLPASSSSSLRHNNSTQIERRDLYSAVTFGDSDDPDVIVAHLAAQREKVRAEKERLRKLQELDTAEEDIDRQMEAARQKRSRDT